MGKADTVMIVGAGPAGLEAARTVADLGKRAMLVETKNQLGGTPYASYASLTPDLQETEHAMEHMLDAVRNNPAVDVRLNTRVVKSEGNLGAFHVTLESADGVQSVEEVGAIVVATGFQHFDPGRETQMYGYYEYDDVITLVDAEKMFKEGKIVRPSTGLPPERVAFIQCVGSRDRQIGNKYCSKVCCGIASKQSIEIKRMLPNAKVFIFYIDMRMYGFWEDQIYWKAQEEYKVNYIRGIVTEIIRKGDKLLIKGEDTTMGRPMEVLMDLVILSVGMEPSKGTVEMSRIFQIPREDHGFLQVVGGPLDTVSTPVPGIFVAGAAAGPKDIEDSVSMGAAAAAKAVGILNRLTLEV
ncbi:FAD-dependent oxidoreductase [Sulfobacillus thermosulfidooxidans]|uniref:FAD-dependent oxidoreductase n=1 Tax=Sulfobacillus thermosulfidooxidans TaxID=28034 RepID=UPI00096B9CF4|nr:FAD-dependent oxidoreductase [Sulfobacillus thermosulfidooxidans]OLZ12164.1 pyridine nucleotide-disulfide oxidoreductase [Sulfobacillus thermosulfidooxidans]OLZ13056.1 pyridine nucleotide-disulfide oxidoreductase [Sulfobacillus thermosulfidooxidans]OLZ21436.1 pyridine nucleotide-disulfide oxidoreductase [Sulfobacillus thermosulfidooxidans]